MKIAYQEHAVDEVMDHFVRGFKIPEDQGKLWKAEATIDTGAGRIVFKLYISEPGENPMADNVPMPPKPERNVKPVAPVTAN